MKEAKHTPGPWLLAASDGVASVFALRYGEIATVDIGKETETQVANTRLIAAAPELAEALIQLLEDIDEFEIDVNRRFYSAAKDGARAALRKAGIIDPGNNDQ